MAEQDADAVRQGGKPRFAPRCGRWRRLPAAAILVLVSAETVAAQGGCALLPAGPAIAAHWADDGALRLSDGRRLAPEGIALPTRLRDPVLVAAAGTAAAGVMSTAAVRPAPTAEDRHGRATGGATLVRPDGPAEGEDLAVALLGAGAGLARPEPGVEPACTAARLAAEAQARQAKLGVWARPDAVLSATDERTLMRHAGLFVIVAGRVRAAGATRDRVYLNFGPRWREDFTVIIRKEDFATILGDSLDPAMLRGTMVEVRGVVREDGGPAILPRMRGEIAVRAEGPGRGPPARGRP